MPSAGGRPATTRPSVDLPAPFGPVTTTNRPASRSRSTGGPDGSATPRRRSGSGAAGAPARAVGSRPARSVGSRRCTERSGRARIQAATATAEQGADDRDRGQRHPPVVGDRPHRAVPGRDDLGQPAAQQAGQAAPRGAQLVEHQLPVGGERGEQRGADQRGGHREDDDAGERGAHGRPPRGARRRRRASPATPRTPPCPPGRRRRRGTRRPRRRAPRPAPPAPVAATTARPAGRPRRPRRSGRPGTGG